MANEYYQTTPPYPLLPSDSAQRLQELVSRNDDIVQETRRRTLDQCATDIRRLQEEHTKEIALLKEQVEKQQSREANKVSENTINNNTYASVFTCLNPLVSTCFIIV